MDGTNPDTVRGFEIILRSNATDSEEAIHHEESWHRKVGLYCYGKA
jgi:hypothetical protein